MVEIIAGVTGQGKTKKLLDRVEEDLKKAEGSLVYIDKSSQHMYELDSKIRLIDMADYALTSTEEFVGFLSGVISQNSDIEEIFLDSFLTIAFIDTNEGLVQVMEKLDVISEKFGIRFVLSISKKEEELPDIAKARIVVSL